MVIGLISNYKNDRASMVKRLIYSRYLSGIYMEAIRLKSQISCSYLLWALIFDSRFER